MAQYDELPVKHTTVSTGAATVGGAAKGIAGGGILGGVLGGVIGAVAAGIAGFVAIGLIGGLTGLVGSGLSTVEFPILGPLIRNTVGVLGDGASFQKGFDLMSDIGLKIGAAIGGVAGVSYGALGGSIVGGIGGGLKGSHKARRQAEVYQEIEREQMMAASRGGPGGNPQLVQAEQSGIQAGYGAAVRDLQAKRQQELQMAYMAGHQDTVQYIQQQQAAFEQAVKAYAEQGKPEHGKHAKADAPHVDGKAEHKAELKAEVATAPIKAHEKATHTTADGIVCETAPDNTVKCEATNVEHKTHEQKVAVGPHTEKLVAKEHEKAKVDVTVPSEHAHKHKKHEGGHIEGVVAARELAAANPQTALGA